MKWLYAYLSIAKDPTSSNYKRCEEYAGIQSGIISFSMQT